MATLPVTATHNYTGDNLGANPIDQIQFTNANSAIATFGSNQFGAGAGLIANNVLLTGNGQTHIVQVSLSATGTFSATAWQFAANWDDANDIVRLGGTAGNDTLTGSSHRDQINGGDGADNQNGGAGDDTFILQTGDLDAGEAIEGGADNDTLELDSGIHDLTLAGTSITNVERIQFFGNNVSLTASGTHFGGAGDFTTVDGNTGGTQALTVNGNSVNLSGVGFTNWGGANQTITINGTNATLNLLSGSSQKDTINGTGSSVDGIRGFGGADTLNGGNGDDTFFYNAAGEVAAGEVISGGGGSDTISLSNAGSSDFSGATISAVETLDFQSGNSTATFSGAQFGAVAIVNVSGGTGTDALTVNAIAAGVDLTGVNFTSWTDGVDTITVNGTAVAETLTGSNKNDIIIGGLGADTLNGGDGDDVFRYTAAGEFSAGEHVDGGNGTDTLEIAGGDHDFASRVFNVEAVRFTGAGSATFVAHEGAPTVEITAVTGSAGANAIVVRGNSAFPAGMNLSSVTFTAWTDGTDTITINGLVGGETLTGSNKNDIIIGGLGADTLNGGDGDDVFRYTATGDADGDQVNGGNGTDTLEISGGNHDFSFAIASIEAVKFTGTGSATVFGSPVSAVTGSAGVDSFIVNGSLTFTTFSGSLSGVAFTNWTDGVDTITINGTPGGETIAGSNHADIINGLGGDDTMTGGAGNDTFDGGDGNDTMSGGSGNDTYVVASLGDTVTENLDDGNDLIYVGVTGFVLSANVETLWLVGGAASGLGNNASGNTLIGNATIDSVVTGGVNGDLLIGTHTASRTTMIGGSGGDVYVTFNSADVIQELANGGNDTVYAAVDYVQPADVETLWLVGAATHGTGNNNSGTLVANNNLSSTITGGISADLLVGAHDVTSTLQGGGGNDTYIVFVLADTVQESPNGGNDIVYSTADFVLPENVETLWLIGGATHATSNAAGGTLVANNNLNSTLTGSQGADLLVAGHSSVTTMAGGQGDDTFVSFVVGDVVQESSNSGNDSLVTYVSQTIPINVETMFLAEGAGAINGTGGSGIDTIIGNAFDNVLDGGVNLDVLVGGAGADTFVFKAGEAVGDIVTDFTSGQDKLSFGGYGAGSLTQIDATHWQINSANGLIHETIMLQNGAAIHAGDFLFV